MSNEALTWAFNLEGVKAGPKFVLVSLADYADEEGSCFPSVPKISRRTGFSQSAVRVHLDILLKLDLIHEQRRTRPNGSRTSNRYYLHLRGPVENHLASDSGGGA
jgi:DNA-binding transcriptional ArsR family regulator